MSRKNNMHWLIGLSFIICHLSFSMIFVSCADEADTDSLVLSGEYLTLETRDISLGGEGGSQTFNIKANCAWTASSTDDWLTLSPVSGNGNSSVTVSAQANSSVTAERTATITIKTNEGLQRSIHVVQSRNTELLSFNVDELSFVSKGETKTLSIQSNTSWTLQGAEDWFTLSAMQGKGNQDITVTAKPNNSEKARQAVLIVQGTSLTARVTLRQEGEQRTITPNVTSLTFEAVGGMKDFVLEGTAAWTVSSSAEWLTLDPLSGTGTTTIHATCADNTELKSRSAQITITATSTGSTQTIEVQQLPASVPTLGNFRLVSAERTEATLAARALSDFDILEYGFCYSTTNEKPSTADTKVEATDRDAQGDYSATLTDLQSGTTYYVRAYARSKVGTGYSSVISVTTSGGKPGEDDNPKPNL